MSVNFSPITVLFVCKSCGVSLNRVDEFIEHKKEDHSNEFQNTKCIVFKEAAADECESLDQDQSLLCQRLSKSQGQDLFDNRSAVVKEPHPAQIRQISVLPTQPEPESKFSAIKEESNYLPDANTNTDPDFDPFDPLSTDTQCITSDLQLDVENSWITLDPLSLQPPNQNHHNQSQAGPPSFILEPKTELYTFLEENEEGSETVKLKPAHNHNPFVLVKKLTSKEIQDAVSNSIKKETGESDSDTSCSEVEGDEEPSGKFEKVTFDAFQCHICGHAFRRRYHLITHMPLHSDSRPIQCPHPPCSATFKTDNNLRQHIRHRHNESRPWPCLHEGCSRSFKTGQNMKKHLAIHSKATLPRNFKCEEENCDKSFLNLTSLKHHRRHYHRTEGEDEELFTCDLCDREFCSELLLRSHAIAHSQDRPFSCNFDGCTAVFKRKTDCDRHKRSKHSLFKIKKNKQKKIT